MDNAMVMPIVATDNKVGRPEKYETHVLPRIKEIEQWVKEGYTDYSIADSLGISPTTLIEYKKNNIEIIEAYKRARTCKNALVMNAQYEKAKGIKEIIKKPIKVKEVIYEEGKRVSEKETVVFADEMIYVPPDTNAADLFLRNNDPDYKGAKSDGIVINNNNNFQLDEAKAKVDKLLTEREKLKAIDITTFEAIE